MDHISLMTNEQIVERLCETMDQNLLEELIHRFYPMVRKYARNYYLHQYDFDDFQQEANIILLRAIESFDVSITPYFAPYYHQMFKNKLYNLLRRDNAECRVLNKSITYLDAESDSTNMSLSEMIADSHRLPALDIISAQAKINAYFDQLSSFERQILIEYLTTGDYDQIAKKLNCSLRKVNDGIYRCHKKLKKIIKF